VWLKETDHAKHPASRSYLRRMLVIFTVYIVLLMSAVWMDNHLELAQPVRIALSLLPVLPVLACIVTIISLRARHG
jgi:cytochrome bd-type quinol oxidase subunit 2